MHFQLQLSHYIFKLRIVKVCIETVRCKKFLVVTLFNNIAVFHNKNEICITDRGKSVGDDKTCSALHQIIHRFLNLDFGSCIDGRSCLIENENLVICKNRSCNGQTAYAFL